MGPFSQGTPLAALCSTFPRSGRVTWLGIRPAHRAPVEAVAEVEADVHRGVIGDHFTGRRNTGRQVTLIQAEHLPVIASFLGLEAVDPAALRRNIAVSGINLLALKGKRFWVGGALLEMTGQCHPCSRMEEAMGAGGYNALRGHGGITARVVEGGMIRLGDAVTVQEELT